MINYNALIVEDEMDSCLFIKSIVKENFPQIGILDFAANIEEAIKALDKYTIDILFLDIQLEDGDAFTLLDSIDYTKLNIIFVTAFDEYAIKAFKYNAIDYITKPIDIQLFKQAVNKILERVIPHNMATRLDKLVSDVKSDKFEKIIIESTKGTVFVEIKNILKITSNGNYAEVYTMDKNVIFTTKSLKDLDEMLPENHFSRINKSLIINLASIASIQDKVNGILKLIDDTQAIVSRRKRKDFFD